MKKWYIAFFVTIIGICYACSIEQEFITPKAKKKDVSKQQDLEMDGNIINSGTNVMGLLADLQKTVSIITKNSLQRINDHMDGVKTDLSKVERTERYATNKKIQHELDHLSSLLISSNQKIQSE